MTALIADRRFDKVWRTFCIDLKVSECPPAPPETIFNLVIAICTLCDLFLAYSSSVLINSSFTSGSEEQCELEQFIEGDLHSSRPTVGQKDASPA